MKSNNSPQDAAALRGLAERRLADAPIPSDAGAHQKLLHELQVHQIELEMQNEELRRIRDALEITSQRYTDLYDFAPMPYVTLEADGRVRHANHAAAALLGKQRVNIVGKQLGHFFTGKFKPVFNTLLENAFKTGDQQTGEMVLLVNGQLIWVAVQTILEAAGASCLFTLQDITERKQAEQAMASANHDQATRELLLRQILDTASVAIFLIDMTGHITRANRCMAEMFQRSTQELEGQEYVELVSPAEQALARINMLALLNSQGSLVDLDRRYRRADGSQFWGHLAGNRFYDTDGQKLGLIGVIADITLMKEHQNQLEQVAHYDVLTGLPNRLLLSDRLQQALLQTHRRGQSLAVAYLDLDGFKAVNDTYGHAHGDKLLVALTDRMKTALRDGDTLARIGGDEFIAILVDLEQLNDGDVVLQRLLKAVGDHLVVNNVVMQISASIGVALYPQDGADADLLIRHADQAMYAAKQAGKNRCFMFDAAQDAVIQSRHESLLRIRTAIDNNEFVLYY